MRELSVCLTLLVGPTFFTACKHVGATTNAAGAKWVDAYRYSGCVLLENEHTRVVLGPQCGGRALEYSLNGVNAIYLDPAHNGLTYDPEKPVVDPSGGRFDIGPETVIPKHPALWLGKWEAEIIGPRSARMTSVKDAATGVQLVREFTLDEWSTHLSCKQTIRNVSKAAVPWCHWSRTFAHPGGVCLIPLTPGSRYPNQYIMYHPGRMLNTYPEDPNIRVREDFLEILGTPKYPKLAIDSYAGWFCYLMKNNLMFVKRFPTYAERAYSDLAANPVCIYYADRFCELEPIGPKNNIAPGESASYTEDWWLEPFPFPKPGTSVDLAEVAKAVPKDARRK